MRLRNKALQRYHHFAGGWKKAKKCQNCSTRYSINNQHMKKIAHYIFEWGLVVVS